MSRINSAKTNSNAPKHPNNNNNTCINKNNNPNQSRTNNNNNSVINLNIDEDPFITKLDDDFSIKVTSKSKLRDILNCDDELIENVGEKAKVIQIKN